MRCENSTKFMNQEAKKIRDLTNLLTQLTTPKEECDLDRTEKTTQQLSQLVQILESATIGSLEELLAAGKKHREDRYFEQVIQAAANFPEKNKTLDRLASMAYYQRAMLLVTKNSDSTDPNIVEYLKKSLELFSKNEEAKSTFELLQRPTSFGACVFKALTQAENARFTYSQY